MIIDGSAGGAWYSIYVVGEGSTSGRGFEHFNTLFTLFSPNINSLNNENSSSKKVRQKLSIY